MLAIQFYCYSNMIVIGRNHKGTYQWQRGPYSIILAEHYIIQ